MTTTDGITTIAEITVGKTIITFCAADGSTLQTGKDYVVTTFPCDLYGGYRLSIFKDGLVAHYFGVHQVAEAGTPAATSAAQNIPTTRATARKATRT